MNLSINWKLFPPKAHYFLYFGGVAAFWPYISVFGKQLGLTESQVGYVFTIAPILGIVSMPLFGSIADRFKIKKKLFLVFNVINLFAILCFTYITTTSTQIYRPVAVECGSVDSFIVYSHQSDDKLNHKWNGSVIRNKILEELESRSYPIICQVDCHSSQENLHSFCENVLGSNQPNFPICTQNKTLSFLAELNFKSMTILELKLLIRIVKIKEFEEENAKELKCFPKTNLANCQINCPDLSSANEAMETVGSLDGNEKKARANLLFALFTLFTILGWIAMAVVTSVADALCFQTLKNRPELYGAQRKWGSIGWGLFTFLAGFFVDLASGDSVLKNYNPCFWIAGALLIVNVYICWVWDVEEEERPKALGRRMIVLILEPKITVFILICIVVGICTGLQWGFLYWYIEDLAKERIKADEMDSGKWIKTLLGLISVVQCFCGELPFFYLAGKFINKLGHVNSMAIVVGTFGVRFLLYSILQNPWWVLPIELLQGLTYGIFYANMATYAYVVSPDGTAATVQGIVGSAFEGFGVSIGSLIGGLMFQHWSGRVTFRIFGLFSLVMCILYKIVMMQLDRKFSPVAQNHGNNDVIETEMKAMNKPIDGSDSPRMAHYIE